MKTLRYIGIAIFAVVMCVNFAACSSDDNEENDSNTLVGTWKITAADEEEMINVIVTFKQDGSATFTSSNPDFDSWPYIKYTYNNNNLKIYFSESPTPDDLIEGPLTINGNTATYQYTWKDAAGKWEDDQKYNMSLQRQ